MKLKNTIPKANMIPLLNLKHNLYHITKLYTMLTNGMKLKTNNQPTPTAVSESKYKL